MWPIILTQGLSWWCTHCSTKMNFSKEDSGRLERHVTFSFDFSQIILIGGGLLVPYSLPGPPVTKQLMQIATVVLDQDGRFQSVFLLTKVLSAHCCSVTSLLLAFVAHAVIGGHISIPN